VYDTFPSLEPVAKTAPSGAHAHVQMMRACTPFVLSERAAMSNKSEPFLLRYKVHVRSRDTDTSRWLSGENANWVTVSLWDTNFCICCQFFVSLKNKTNINSMAQRLLAWHAIMEVKQL
jgi:hypothetical protein